MKNENDQKTVPDFTTSDIALGAALLSLGFEYGGVRGDNTHKLDFVFTGGTEVLMAEASYYRGELKVEVASFYNSLRLLKGEIYDTRRAK